MISIFQTENLAARASPGRKKKSLPARVLGWLKLLLPGDKFLPTKVPGRFSLVARLASLPTLVVSAVLLHGTRQIKIGFLFLVLP